MHCLAHFEGEVASARAAAELGVCYVQSTFSTCSISDITSAVPDSLKWKQVFAFEDFSITENLVKAADEGGYKAIVFTVDHPTRPSNWTVAKCPVALPHGVTMRNIEAVFPLKINRADVYAPKSDGFKPTCAQTWLTVEKLKKLTSLPLVLKGILTAEDAQLAVQHGVCTTAPSCGRFV